MASPLAFQCALLAATFLTGIALGALYDFLRVLRYGAPAALGLLLDLFFCLAFAAALFLLGMGPGRGSVRLYMPPLLLCGALVWLLLFGAAARAAFRDMLRATRRVLRRAAVPMAKFVRAVKFFGNKRKKLFSFLQKGFTITGKKEDSPNGTESGAYTDEAETNRYHYEDRHSGDHRLRGGHAG
ncbi:MAG: hypothetical protein LUG15_08075 [Oscillospiraceae bacterium]|nr:hypothetical protein [Oscillospiraceae bacterium]